ncbi:MAG: hypothetical protein ACRD0Q_10755 [Acidimicrobiales bacterium]
MTALVGALVAGFLTARLGWVATRPLFSAPGLARTNYRGLAVPTAVGVLIPLAAMVVEAGRAAAGSLGVGDAAGMSRNRALVLIAAAGFGILGLLDDVVGDGGDRGFRGHLKALAGGRVTTGMVKLVVGTAVAVVVVAPVARSSPARLLSDTVLVALAANLGNLFDRAPGRAVKISLVAFAALALLTGAGAAVLGGVAVVIGAGVGLLSDDLRERLMLGDSGANVLGAALGVGAVLACSPATRDLAVAGLAGLTVLAEVVSFGRVIEAVGPLRAFDRAGRRPPD